MNKAKVAFTLEQNEAIAFIMREHRTQRRKGTVLPYVVHPIEVASYVGRFYPENQELILAAYLHDVLEDTDVDPVYIELTFGSRVLELVEGVTAQKGATWLETRKAQVEKLKTAELDVVRLKACDMLSNATSIAFDYKHLGGEDSFAKFKNATPVQVRWYYGASYATILRRLSTKQFVAESVVTSLYYQLLAFGALELK